MSKVIITVTYLPDQNGIEIDTDARDWHEDSKTTVITIAALAEHLMSLLKKDEPHVN